MNPLRILPAIFSSEPPVNTMTDLKHLFSQARKNGFEKAANIYNKLLELGYKSTSEVSDVLNSLTEEIRTIDVDSIHSLFESKNMPTSLVYDIAGFNYKKVNSVPGLNIFISFDAAKLTQLMLIREEEFNIRRRDEVFGKLFPNFISSIPGVDTLQFRQQTIVPVEPAQANTPKPLEKKSAA